MTSLSKPVTRKTRANVPHGCKPEIVITLYPGGTIGLREAGRAKASEVYFDLGSLYVRGVQNKIAVERMRRAKTKAAEKKLRKQLR